MRYNKIKNSYVIRIDRGEKIIESLFRFIDENNIKTGFFTGIGAVSHCTTKYYNYNTKEYIEQNFQQDLEITSLIGNVTMMNKNPIIHAHIILGDPDMNLKGGHLQEAIVGATCEIFFMEVSKTIKRKFDEETNLNFLDL
jgi:predicted DNA-binding protein with PD1-like motif